MVLPQILALTWSEILALVLASLLALLALVVLMIARRVHQQLNQLKAERDRIAGEEHRMFEFLQHLGETLESDARPSVLHKTIVDGISSVTQSTGGSIYLIDAKSGKLIPSFISEACPPLLEIPEHIAVQDRPRSVESYARLTPVAPNEGMLGSVLANKKAVKSDDIEAHPSFTPCSKRLQKGIAVMMAPMTYNGKDVGVIAVADTSGRVYSDNDYEVFRSAASQSAFALGNLMIHKDASEKRQLEQEVKTASDVQKILLPSEPPKWNGYKIAGINLAAKIVSGDYHDYVDVDERHCGVVISDVSGKGVPASLLMAMCRGVLRSKAFGELSPTAVLSQVNRQTFPDIREDMFISMAYLILDQQSDNIVISRAGHDPPMHYISKDHVVKSISPPGMAVGIDSGDVFDRVTRDLEFEMETGDCILLYTDGVNEAMNRLGDEFGIDRMKEGFLSAASKGASEVVETIENALTEFMGNHPQHDDITLIVIEKT